MFAKLLKYEWKRSAGILSILTLAALSIGILGAVILRVAISIGKQMTDTTSSSPLLAGLIVVLSFMFLALVVYAAVSELLLLYRFYKSRFTDEGYLTFTLPVNSHQIFLSALLNNWIWMVISLLTVFVSIAVAVLFGTAEGEPINTQIFEYLSQIAELFRLIFADLHISNPLIIVLQMIIAPISTLVITMSCITIGATIAKKLKLLVAFGLYYAQSIVMGVVTSIAQVFLMIAQMESDAFSFSGTYLIQILLQLAMAATGYFLSTYLMSKKLNLP